MAKVKATATGEKKDEILFGFFFPDLDTSILAINQEEADKKAAKLRAERFNTPTD